VCLSQVQFLNAVIVEIQRKNVELEAWRQSMTGADSINGHLVKCVVCLQ